MTSDFDFFAGSWDSTHRRLPKPLTGSDDWCEFTGSSVCHRYLDGAANVDQVDLPALGFSGLTVRLFDPAAQVWSLYWINSRDGLLTTPVVGTFAGGVGTFLGDDTHDGVPIRVRYTWSGITATTAHWEQAFAVLTDTETLDGARAWETNWVTDFVRRS